ncbi:MAG: DUF5615 family PIN-like protein [Blastocatellia bacterium]|nr:DUF5615 family PIN-like protein [Blastocatellia bacterium]
MKLKDQADNDLDERILRAVLRLNSEVDFQTAHALELHGVPDLEVLRRAAAEGRLLVSHDLKTMPYHFAEFVAQQDSPGVFLISPKLSIIEAADWLHLIWEASEAEEYVNSIRRLP